MDPDSGLECCYIPESPLVGFRGFSSFYDWICWRCRVPPWKVSFNYCRFGNVELIPETRGDGCFSFLIRGFESKGRDCLVSGIKQSSEEESNSMQVMTSPLLYFFVTSISHALHHPQDVVDKMGLSLLQEVREESLCDHSLTQSYDYPRLFNSAFACMSILLSPYLIATTHIQTIGSLEILNPELFLALGAHLEAPLIRRFGSFFTTYAPLGKPEWKPLNWAYTRNTSGPPEVKIYCPILSMKTTPNHAYELPNTSSADLNRALIYQQLESILQLRYDVSFQGNFLQLHVGVVNFRCNVHPYENTPSTVKRDLLSTERYFPSKICLTIVPQDPSIDQISVGQSSANPSYQIMAGKGSEVSYQSPKDVSIKISTTTSSTININNWKFEQSADGAKGIFKWILYDSSNANGTEVTSSKPSKFTFFTAKPSPWYRDRYRKASSPFTEQGGVLFAKDKYGETITWTLNKNMEGQIFKFKIEGTIWLTYWPNVNTKTYFYETRYHEFCEMIELPLIRQP